MNMINEITKAEKYDAGRFLSFIEKNNLLKDFIVNINDYKNLTEKETYDRLAFYIVRQFDKSQHDRWVNNIKIRAKQNNADFEYYLAFCMSNKDRFVEALCVIGEGRDVL